MKIKKVPCCVCKEPTDQEYFPESEHNTDTGKPYKIQFCTKSYCRAVAWERVRTELRERTGKYVQPKY